MTELKKKSIKVYETSDGKIFMIDDEEKAFLHQKGIDREKSMDEFVCESKKILKAGATGSPRLYESMTALIEEIRDVFELGINISNVNKLQTREYAIDEFIHRMTQLYLANPGGLEEFFMLLKNYYSRIK